MSIITDRTNHEHYKDLLRTAEQYRLEREALEGRPKKQKVIHRAMIWLMSSLTILGKQLRMHIQGPQLGQHHNVVKTHR